MIKDSSCYTSTPPIHRAHLSYSQERMMLIRKLRTGTPAPYMCECRIAPSVPRKGMRRPRQTCRRHRQRRRNSNPRDTWPLIWSLQERVLRRKGNRSSASGSDTNRPAVSWKSTVKAMVKRRVGSRLHNLLWLERWEQRNGLKSRGRTWRRSSHIIVRIRAKDPSKVCHGGSG